MLRNRFWLCCAVALGLRLLHLGSHDFWNNELFSIYWVQNPVAFLWGDGFKIETNPPFYYTILKFWTAAWGAGEATARLLSVLFSLLCLPIMYRLGAMLWDRRAGVFAAALLAVAPMQIQIAQTARAYALLSLLTAIAMLALAWLLRGRDWRAGAVVYAVAATSAVYTHATAIVILVALNAPSMLCLMRTRRWQSAGFLLAANLCVAVAALPALMGVLHQTHSPNLDYISSMTAIGWLCQAAILVAGLNPPLFLAVLAVSGLVFLYSSAFARTLPPPAAVLLVQTPALFVAMMILLDQARPVMQFQVLAWLALPVCVLAGALMGRIKGGISLVAGVLLTLVFLVVDMTHAVTGKLGVVEDWRGMVQDLQRQRQNGDLVVIGPQTTPLGLVRYDKRLPSVLYRLIETTKPQTETAQTMLAQQLVMVKPIDKAALQTIIQKDRKVWMVLEAMDVPAVPLAAWQRPPGLVQEFAGLKLLSWN